MGPLELFLKARPLCVAIVITLLDHFAAMKNTKDFFHEMVTAIV